jgi:hypothetical protein
MKCSLGRSQVVKNGLGQVQIGSFRRVCWSFSAAQLSVLVQISRKQCNSFFSQNSKLYTLSQFKKNSDLTKWKKLCNDYLLERNEGTIRKSKKGHVLP